MLSRETMHKMLEYVHLCGKEILADAIIANNITFVVRCKDCKYYNVFRLECHNEHMNGVIGIDGFCSYGERRTK